MKAIQKQKQNKQTNKKPKPQQQMFIHCELDFRIRDTLPGVSVWVFAEGFKGEGKTFL